MEILFYALYKTPIEKALPSLLEKIYSSKSKAHLLCENDEQVILIDDAIWTYSPLSFLPHGSIQTTVVGFEHKQPIWLSSNEALMNNPDVFISLKPTLFSNLNIKKYIFFYDLHKENYNEFEYLQAELKKKNQIFTLWVQQENGAWQKK